MKLCWTSRSPYVRYVMTTVHELGLADRIQTVHTFVNINAPNARLMESNPLNKIPTLLLDDGTAIYDSRVICRYLDETFGGNRLVPVSGPDRYRILTGEALGIGLIDLLLLWLIERNRPEQWRAQDLIETNALKFKTVLDRLEHLLPRLRREPLQADQIAIGTALSYADFRFGDLDWRKGREGLAEWHRTFRTRPSVTADPFFDDLAAAATAAR